MPTNSSNPPGKDKRSAHPFAPPEGVTLDSVLITDELEGRPARAPDYKAESQALLALAQNLADSPRIILQKLSEVALKYLSAGSAGVSLISKETGDFYWPAIAGEWAGYMGAGAPRHFGPCSVVLEKKTVQLFSHPELYYPYLLTASPIITEVLLCPFDVNGEACGTVWVVSHDDNRRFDAEDKRLLLSLGTFASAAYQNLRLLEDLDSERAAFQAGEKRLRTLADTAPAMLWITEPDGECSFLSKGWYDYTGQTANEALGAGWLDATHPEDRAETERIFNEATQKRQSFKLDYRLKNADGEYRWASDSGRPRFDEEGEFIGYIGSVTDVHERKLSEEKLRKSEEQLRRTHAELETIYEQSPVGLVQIDANLRFIRINAALASMNGVSAEDHIGKTIHEVLPEIAPKVESDFRHILETGEAIIDIELKGQTAADPGVEHIWLESWFPLRDESGKVTGLNIVAQDITKRKIAEQRLQLLSDTVAKLLRARDPDKIVRELFVDVAAHLDVDTYFNFIVNEEGDALNLHSCVGIPEETANAIKRLEFGQAICGTVAQTRSAIHAIDIQNSDYDKADLVRGFGIQTYACNPLMVGDRLLGTLSFASRSRTTFNEDALQFMRVIAQYTAVALDRLQTEAAMDKARQQAEAANRAKDKFLAVLSHELRTPLTPVLATVGAMESDLELSSAVREDISMIRRNVELEARLIDDLLDLSRITSGKLRLQTESVEIGAAIRHAVETCRPFILEKSLHLHCRVPDQVLYVEADPTRLQQVLWNLLKNAAKFTRKDGDIHVRVSLTVEKRIRIEVTDTGKGIEPEALSVIFNAFEQGAADVTRQFGGMGLGLAISKALVEMHGGTICAASSGTNKGSTFSIELPLLSPHKEPVFPVPNRDSAKTKSPLRLLVVEDHMDTLAVLTRLFKSRGYSVKTAVNVSDALALAEQQTFDVLVSDIGLPDASGYDLMREIKARYAMKGVAMSGFGMDEDMRKSREAGFSEHIVKPLNFSQLEQAILHAAKQLEIE